MNNTTEAASATPPPPASDSWFQKSALRWLLTWGLLFVASMLVWPTAGTLGKAWPPLHTGLEVTAVALSVSLFFLGSKTLAKDGAQVGTKVGILFLLVGIFDVAHLASFPGMPEFFSVNHDAKSISFWLVSRFLASLALIVCVTSDWEARVSARTQQLMLAGALGLAVVAVPGIAFWADAYPTVLWLNPGLSLTKIAAELCVTAMMVVALVLEVRKSPARKRLYEPAALVQALLTLIVAELCFTGYRQSNDVMMVLGHAFKAIGYFQLYRALVDGMIKEPYRHMHEAEAQAEKAVSQMRAMFDASPDGVMLVEASGTILRVNQQFTTLMGFESSQIVGLPVDVLLPERYRSGHGSLLQGFMQAPTARGMAAGRTLPARRRDGSEFPVDISLSPIQIEGKEAVIASIRDMTDRVNMLEQLQLSEQRTQSFLDNSADWIWEADPSGTLVYCSQRVRDILGHEPEAVKGRSWISLLTPPDAQRMGPQLRELVVRRDPWVNLTLECSTASGGVRQLQTNARPSFEADGRFIGYRGISRDVTAEHALQRELRQSERLFRHAFNDFPTGMGFVSCEGVMLRANAQLAQLLGAPPESLVQTKLARYLTIEAWVEASQAIVSMCEGRLPLYSAEVRIVGVQAAPVWCRVDIALIDSEENVPGPLLMMVTDISAEKAARATSQRLEAIIEKMGDTVGAADTQGRNTYLNPYGRTLMGIGLNEDISNESIADHHPPGVAHMILTRAMPHAAKHGTWEGETIWKTRSGEEIASWQVIMAHKGESGKVEYWTTVARDIRERKRLEDRLSFQATHDALTGLPNRLLMRDRLQQAISLARRERKLMAVVFMDLDNFKRINDTLGHAMGDKVLIEVAQRMRGGLRDSDSLARQGGDEFIALIPGMNTVNDFIAVIDKLIGLISAPISLGEQQVVVTCSVGISLFPFDHEDVDELLRKADVAMYRAKELGRNNYRFYTSDMDERFNFELQLESDLRYAIGSGELFMHYQPKLSVVSGEITGFEALVRWLHPQRGLISPVEFIPVAERSMLIVHLGEWVLRQVVSQIATWRTEGKLILPVAVNVSAHQFEYTDVARLIRQVLTESQVEGAAIELEITEGVLMRDPLSTARTLSLIKALGVKIAVDDFGTGYSSLGYLKQFPVDVLKVDRSFVKDVTSNPDDAAIVRAIVAMAHNLGIEVVAEGVETREQLGFLRDCNCDYIQGYLFARPMPSGSVYPFIEAHDIQGAAAL